MCNHSAWIWLTNGGGKSHTEVMIIIIVTKMLLMLVHFQSDANPVQVLCTPSQRGKQCLTSNVMHIGEEYRDIQSRGMTGNRCDWKGGCCKHYFLMAAHVALLLPLHIYIVNTSFFSSLLLPPLSPSRGSSSSRAGFCHSTYQFLLHLIPHSDTTDTNGVNPGFMWLAWVNNIWHFGSI